MMWLTRITAIISFALVALSLRQAAIAEEAGRHGGRNVTVDTPAARVAVQGSRNTRVRVGAPHTAIDVNTRRRRVRIDVPYYHGTILW